MNNRVLSARGKKTANQSVGQSFFPLISFLMRWVFMHIALKGCSPPHTNEPVQFWIGFGLVLIGGSGLNPLGLLTPHWIIQQVIDRNASKRHMGPIYSSDLRSRAIRRWTKSKIDFCFLCMN